MTALVFLLPIVLLVFGSYLIAVRALQESDK